MTKSEVIKSIIDELQKDGYALQFISPRFMVVTGNLESISVKPEYIKAWTDVHMPVQTFIDRSQYPNVAIVFILEDT